jgi:hypothetical protein
MTSAARRGLPADPKVAVRMFPRSEPNGEVLPDKPTFVGTRGDKLLAPL